MREKKEWDEMAIAEVRKILKELYVCNLPELEARISDKGVPKGVHPEPSHISSALEYLLDRNEIRTVKSSVGNFYLLHSDETLPKGQLEEIVSKKESLYSDYLQMAENEKLCLDVASQMIREILENSPKIKELESDTGLANYVGRVTSKGVGFKVHVMNSRQWLYPDSFDLWRFIESCIEDKYLAVPIFSRGSLFTFSMFKHLGVLGYSTERQFFHPMLADRLAPIIRTFGFDDVTTSCVPSSNDKSFINDILPRNALNFYQRFIKNMDLIASWPRSQLIENFTTLSAEFASQSRYSKSKEEAVHEGIPIQDVLDEDDIPF